MSSRSRKKQEPSSKFYEVQERPSAEDVRERVSATFLSGYLTRMLCLYMSWRMRDEEGGRRKEKGRERRREKRKILVLIHYWLCFFTFRLLVKAGRLDDRSLRSRRPDQSHPWILRGGCSAHHGDRVQQVQAAATAQRRHFLWGGNSFFKICLDLRRWMTSQPAGLGPWSHLAASEASAEGQFMPHDWLQCLR